jgi:hypothetical protein
MFSLTRQSYDLCPPPRPVCSGFDELGDATARELEDQLAVFGEREDLAGDPEPDRFTEPGSRGYAGDPDFRLLDAEPSGARRRSVRGCRREGTGER